MVENLKESKRFEGTMTVTMSKRIRDSTDIGLIAQFIRDENKESEESTVLVRNIFYIGRNWPRPRRLIKQLINKLEGVKDE